MVECPYCKQAAQLVSGDAVYPHRDDLHDKKFWRCAPCDAWVGCHTGGTKDVPFGRLANAELRKAKMAAHAAFDPLWKNGLIHRREAYAWLARIMQVPAEKAHIGEMDVEQCNRLIAFCKAFKHV